MAFTCSFVASGYVAVKTVDHAVSFTRGFYYIYGGKSVIANRMFFWEIIVVMLFLSFSAGTTVMTYFMAAELWEMLDVRLAEAAAESIGIETPLDWDKAMKIYVLCMVVALTALVSGYSIGQVADELVAYWDEYDNDVDKEGSSKRTGFTDPAGTSAFEDLLMHMATTFYGVGTLATVSLGGAYFAYEFVPRIFADNFTCDLQQTKYNMANTYQAAMDVRKAMTDRASC